MHEKADLNISAQNQAAIAALAVANPAAAPVLAKLQPRLTDTVPFFGAGVGFDIHVSRHVGLRFATDWVRSHMFSGLLDWQNNVRFSVGPVWGFGEVSPRTR